MIIGLFLGASLATFIASLSLITMGLTNTLQENFITGAVIGPEVVTSYATITLIVSLILILIFTLILRKRSKRFVSG